MTSINNILFNNLLKHCITRSVYSKYILPRPLTESAAIDMYLVGDIGYCVRPQKWPFFL